MTRSLNHHIPNIKRSLDISYLLTRQHSQLCARSEYVLPSNIIHTAINPSTQTILGGGDVLKCFHTALTQFLTKIYTFV